MTLLRFLFAALCLSVFGQAQSVAFTFDDGPSLASTPRLSPQERP
jgi:peptidoglycan/xylan/chitin deacetylase (PgdA/CDA1 family)